MRVYVCEIDIPFSFRHEDDDEVDYESLYVGQRRCVIAKEIVIYK